MQHGDWILSQSKRWLTLMWREILIHIFTELDERVEQVVWMVQHTLSLVPRTRHLLDYYIKTSSRRINLFLLNCYPLLCRILAFDKVGKDHLVEGEGVEEYFEDEEIPTIGPLLHAEDWVVPHNKDPLVVFASREDQTLTTRFHNIINDFC